MTAGEDKTHRVRVEIRSITVNSRIVPNLKGKPVKTPNWEPGIDLRDNGGSKRPGIFEIDKPGRKGLTVHIKIEGVNPGDSARLIGSLKNPGNNDRFIFSGEIKEGKPVQSLTVLPQPEPRSFVRLMGDMEWRLHLPDGKVVPIPPNTRMEIYWIFHYPAKMYHRRGVWVEVLRLLDQVCAEADTKDDVISRVVRYCHSRAGMRYDSFYGSCYFTDSGEGGLFKLKAFLNKTTAICNCYDQAGAVQTLLGAVGIHVDWLYMNYFGFINIARLNGRGECNNPFFLSVAGEPHLSAKIVSPNDPKRTFFANHAFCGIKKRERIYILDSCVGPHLGDEPGQQYLEISIDKKTKLYEKPGTPRPGTTKDMKEYPGILHVEVMGCDKEVRKRSSLRLHEDRRVKEFKDRIGFAACGKNLQKGQGVACNWGNTLDYLEKMFFYPVLTRDNLIFDDTRFGCKGGVLERIYRKKKEWLRIEIFVSNKGIDPAKERLLKIAAGTTMARIPFVKNPENPGQLSVVTPNPGRKNAICVFHNTCFFVEAHDSPIKPVEILHRLCHVAQNHLVENLSDYVPHIEQVIVSPPSQEIKIGGRINMEIFSTSDSEKIKDLTLLFQVEGENLIFEHEEFYSEETNIGSLRFSGKSSGVTLVFPLLTDWDTLLCGSGEVKITVV